jgi:hypothetical protein
MPGPAKVPAHLKLLRGTLMRPPPQDASTPALPVLDVEPSPPPWLKDAEALREWKRLAPVLTANRLLHEGNIGLLAQLCAVHGRLVKIWSSEGSANAALVMTYRMLSNSLGMLGWELQQSARPDNRQSKQANRFAANAANNVRGGTR